MTKACDVVWPIYIRLVVAVVIRELESVSFSKCIHILTFCLTFCMTFETIQTIIQLFGSN